MPTFIEPTDVRYDARSRALIQMRAAFSGYYCGRYEIVSSGAMVGLLPRWAVSSRHHLRAVPTAKSSRTGKDHLDSD